MFQDENEWLREELGDTERRLEEALASLAAIQEEKKQWLFMEEVGQDNLFNNSLTLPQRNYELKKQNTIFTNKLSYCHYIFSWKTI